MLENVKVRSVTAEGAAAASTGVSSRANPIAELLSQRQLNTISELALLQDCELSAEQFQQLHRLQSDFLRTTLSEGFHRLTTCLSGARREAPEPAPHPPSSRFRSVVGRLQAISARMASRVDTAGWQHDTERRSTEHELLRVALDLQGCYADIHAGTPGEGRAPPDPASDREVLFLEFVTGLCMAWLTAEVRRLAILDLLRSVTAAAPERGDARELEGAERSLAALTSTRPSTHGWSSSIRDCDAEVTAFSRILDTCYLDNLLSVTADCIGYCHGASPGLAFLDAFDSALRRRPPLRAVMDILASMRHIPADDPGHGPPGDGGRRRAAILGMAQALHWNGIGSDDGGLWHEQVELAHLTPHSLSYTDNFSTASDAIAMMLGALRTDAADATARFISAAAAQDPGIAGSPERGIPAGARVFRIIEDASGPHAQFVSEVAVRLNEIFRDAGGAVVHATTADGAGSNLASLAQHALRGSTPAGGTSCKIQAIRYRDLTLPLARHSLDGAARGLNEPYDAYVVCYGLHHVTDCVRGLEILRDALRFGARVVRAGGCLAFAEPRESGPAMEALLPLDMTDRAGRLPTELHDYIPFSALAVPAGRSAPDGARRVKLARELRGYRRASPSKDNPMVAFALFEVVELPEAVLSELDELRARGRLELCDELIGRYAELKASDPEQG